MRSEDKGAQASRDVRSCAWRSRDLVVQGDKSMRRVGTPEMRSRWGEAPGDACQFESRKFGRRGVLSRPAIALKRGAVRVVLNVLTCREKHVHS